MFVRKLFSSNIRPIFGLRLISGDRKLPLRTNCNLPYTSCAANDSLKYDDLPSTPTTPCAELSSMPSKCDDLISPKGDDLLPAPPCANLPSILSKSDDLPLSLPKNANKSISYPDEVEKQVNVQIRNELQTSHIYLAMAHHFASANYFIGFAAFYLQMSNEERGHAFSLIGYQNLRGGSVVLDALNKPEIPFKDIPTSLDYALNLEINNKNEFTRLHAIAQQNSDLVSMDLITSTYLKEQTASIKFIRNLIAQLNAAQNDPIIQQLVNQQLHRKFAPKCIDDLKKISADSSSV